MPSVSVIVPVYNVEKYLRECLDSVVAQTLPDMEIIIINDGSTDHSLEIIQEYAARDNRIVVIDKENEGYGKTMNRGLDAARGEYIGIVESDDWVEPNMFARLYDVARTNDADMVKCDFEFFYSGTTKTECSWPYGIPPELYNRVFCPRTDNPTIFWNGHPSIWTCLYRTQMLREKNIRFVETPGAAFQDMGFKPKAFAATNRFVIIPDVLLHYRKHANNSDKNNNKVYAVCDAHADADNWARKNMNCDADLIQILNRCKFNNFVWNCRRLTGAPAREFRKYMFKEFRPIVSSGDIYIRDMTVAERTKLLKIMHANAFWIRVYSFCISVSRLFWRDKYRDGYFEYQTLGGLLPIYRRKFDNKKK